MFKSLPMQRMTLYLVREDAVMAACELARHGVFDPQQEEVQNGDLPDFPGARFAELYNSAARRFEKILSFSAIELEPDVIEPELVMVSENELMHLDQRLGEIWHEFSCCEEAERHLGEEQRHIDQLIKALDEYAALDIDLGLLQGKSRFLDVRIGVLPMDEVGRLREALSLLDYTLTVFKQTDHTAHLVLAGLPAAEQELETILRAASFRSLKIPPEFHDRPSRLHEEFLQQQQAILDDLEVHRQMVERNRNQFQQEIREAARLLARAAPYAQLADALRARGGLSQVGGWVPADRVERLTQSLRQCLNGRLTIQLREPLVEERLEVPSAFRYPRLLRPFASLVKAYGIPRYGELDPSWLFALSFVLMFGMMFGDLGHGLVLSLAAFLLTGRWRGARPFVLSAGVSSIFFGLLYGSVFGLENLIAPLWISPLSDPVLMLKLALYWGVGFILLACLIYCYNRLIEGRLWEAMMSGNGLAGLVFYLGLIYSGERLSQTGTLGLKEGLWLLLPLLVFMSRVWVTNSAPWFERLLIVVIEGFELGMRYISNTLSFLRVAAFSINHVALAVAIFMLADMMTGTGHWLTLLFGNLFSLILEGGIIAIQVLRLEYFEGFSRYFSGDGRPFQPLSLKPDKASQASLDT